ncbi:MAG: protein kinase [Planctomycetota bacterium]
MSAAPPADERPAPRFAWTFGELPPLDTQRRPAAAGLQPGALFAGRYRVEALLGAGGMGAVFRARELDPPRTVAIKLLSDVDPARTARFLREGQLLASLAHPGIVHVYAGGVTAEGQPFLVMEEVEGARELDARLREVGREDGLDLLEQVADAVAFAHARGVVHRDLKPGNVLVDAQGRARVCDFGLAWREDVDRLTRTGAMIGTPLYMAPEQAGLSGYQEPTPPADVWSLGVMLYEHLAGELPFRGATLIELLSAVGGPPPPAPHAIAPGVSPALSAVCLRALEREPARRYPDAGAMAAALRAARRAGGAAPLGRALRALGVAIALAAAAGLGAWLGSPAAQDSASSSSSPSSSGPPSSPTPPRPTAAQALEAAERALRGGAPVAEVFAALERARAAATSPAERRAALLATARAAWARSEHARCLAATAELGEEREARYLRARALLSSLRPTEARPLIEELRGLEDRWGLLARALGAALYHQAGDPGPLLERLLARDRRDVHAALLASLAAGERDDGATQLRILEDLGPAAAGIVAVQVGLASYWMGPIRGEPVDLGRARAALARAEALAGPERDADLLQAQARLATLTGDDQRAVELLRELFERRPSATVAVSLGVGLDAQGRYAEARDVWRRGAEASRGALVAGAGRLTDPALRLRMLRAAGALGLEGVLPAVTLRWIGDEVARLDPAARPAGRALLEPCVRGWPWWRLQPLIAALRAASSAPSAGRLEGLVALARDQLDVAQAALERAAARAPDAELELMLADIDARRGGLPAGTPRYEAIARRWPTSSAGITARASVRLIRREPGVVPLLEEALAGHAPPLLARSLRALAFLQEERVAEALASAERDLEVASYADLLTVRLHAFAMGQLAQQRPGTPPAIWGRIFARYEALLQVTEHPAPRLNAAELALLAPRSAWLGSVEPWLQEAERAAESGAGAQAEFERARAREVRGLATLVRGGSEEEVLRSWRGLDHVGAEARQRFARRFGHEPRLR